MPAKSDTELLFANVVLPLPLRQTFTYLIPNEWHYLATPGKRVIVQFGSRKLMTAIIQETHKNEPGFKYKSILSVLDDIVVVNDFQFRLWSWMSGYYMCSQGEIMKAALPSGLKLESESLVFPGQTEDYNYPLSEKEMMILDLVRGQNGIDIRSIQKALNQQQVIPLLKAMVEKRLVIIEENLINRFTPKKEMFVRLADNVDSEEQLNLVFSSLSRAKKQSDLLLLFCSMSKAFTSEACDVKRSTLMQHKEASNEALKALVNKGIIDLYEKKTGRLVFGQFTTSDSKDLTDNQSKALTEIEEQFKFKKTVLLHGVTSSGKTEIYIRLIEKMLEQGKQVLYLLPEIALTGQIINRLRTVFGNSVGVYHSRFSDAERVETYMNLLNNTEHSYKIILGVRSSVFLPFQNLGLIIIDEEHENTYKQYDPAPRYNARDTAIVLASLHNANVLLGTATPSLETYHNAIEGKYGLVELFSRYSDIQLPEIQVVDLKEENKQKKMISHFSQTLLDEIEATISQGKQVILFQNRRGFSPYIECETCGWIPGCQHCDVMLTYHKSENRLKCHYCGYSTPIPTSCPACGSPQIITRGFGTEKIEDELSVIFPDYSIARLDLDTSRARKSAEKIISDFEDRKLDILVGTQMVSKGLDFDNVSLVGILNADNLINFPDFRAHERSFQLMAQVSGRAGRKNTRGKVIIQTRQPNHPVIEMVVKNNFDWLFRREMNDRKDFDYPPFTRLTEIILKHKKQEIVLQAAREITALLKQSLGKRVLGPETPLISRIQNYHQQHILLKVEKKISYQSVRETIFSAADHLMRKPKFSSLRINIDVDPQ